MGTVLKTAPGVILGGIVLAGLGLGGYYLLQPSQGSSGSGQVSETPDTADAAREVKLTKANAVLARFCLDSLGGESQSDRAYSRAAKAVDTLMSAAMSNGDDLLPSGETTNAVVLKGADALRSCSPDLADELESATE